MAKKYDPGLSEIKADLKFWVRDFRRAQTDLKKLREAGANESDIRNVMQLMGFESVTPDEFLAARTSDDIARIVMKVGRFRAN
jgi:hypothetical protein